MKLEISRQFSKNPQISSFVKIRPVRAELFLAGGRMGIRTDRHDEDNSRFSQFYQRANKGKYSITTVNTEL
jgi:hypothetical protein